MPHNKQQPFIRQSKVHLKCGSEYTRDYLMVMLPDGKVPPQPTTKQKKSVTNASSNIADFSYEYFTLAWLYGIIWRNGLSYSFPSFS